MKRGFTLIELLVVIAIIGILSGIVLTSLNSARSKASDAAVQATLAGMRSSAEMYFSSSTPNSYGTSAGNGACSGGMFNDTNIQVALGSISTPKICTASGNTYIIAAQMPSGSPWWCIDNTGTSTRKDTPPSSSSTPSCATW